MQGRRALDADERGNPQGPQQDPEAPDTATGEAGEAEAVTVVVTPQELQRAVVAGAPHIEIQAHLDLTTLPLLLNGRLLGTDAGVLPASVKSITVRPPELLISR